MRLHEQLGGEGPDSEAEALLADWRRGKEEGADMIRTGAIGHCADGYHRYCGGAITDRGDGSLVYCECRCHGKVRADQDVEVLTCPDCDKMTSDGEYCGECLSERASWYIPDEGGENG